MTKKTDWYPSSIRPARNGWYEIKWPSGNIRRRYWNGREWVQHPRGYVSAFNFLDSDDRGHWRGLIKPYWMG